MLAMERCRYSAGARRRSAAARSTVRPAGTYPLSGSCADVWSVSASGTNPRRASSGSTSAQLPIRPTETGRAVRFASLDEAVGWCEEAKRTARPVSVGLIGNCAEVLPELARRGFVPDALTDQTSAHDPLNGYVPAGLTVERAAALRRSAPAEYLQRSMASIAAHVEAMLALKRRGAATFDYGH